jgi:hypothetical protein
LVVEVTLPVPFKDSVSKEAQYDLPDVVVETPQVSSPVMKARASNQFQIPNFNRLVGHQ